MAVTPSSDLGDSAKSSRDTDPNEIFKRMVINDKLQNKNLSSKLAKSNGLKGSNGVEGKSAKKDGQTKMRFVVCTLGVLSLAMAQMLRGTMNLCITSMVHPSMLHNTADQDHLATSTELPSNFSTETTTIASGLIVDEDGRSFAESYSTFDPILYFFTDKIEQATTTDQPVSETTSGSVVTSTIIMNDSLTIEEDPEEVDRFMWTVKQQSLIKGGFFYSYFFFMILGGRISEIYGAKYVILLGVFGSAIINLATPWMARNSFVMLVGSRVVMGVLQSGALPAMYALVSRWLTMSEASIYAPMMKMNLRVGQLLASLVPGLVSQWPQAFYVVGMLGIVWSVLFWILATSEPSTNRWVNESELNHINKKKRVFQATKKPEEIKMDDRKTNELPVGKEQKKQAEAGEAKAPSDSTPWIKILTSPSVIALVIVKYTYNLCPDFISIELPSYLKYAHEASRQEISAIQTGLFSIQIFLIVAAGWLAKEMIKKKPFGVSKTVVRNLFQGVCSIGGGFVMVLVALNSWDLDVTAIAFQVTGLLCIFAAGGETMAPYDLSERYPATIMGIANSVANLSGITITALTGFLLDNQAGSMERWHMVIGILGSIDLLGGLIFVSIYRAELLKFERQKQTGDVEMAIPDIKAVAEASAPSTDTKEEKFVEKKSDTSREEAEKRDETVGQK